MCKLDKPESAAEDGWKVLHCLYPGLDKDKLIQAVLKDAKEQHKQQTKERKR